MILFGHKLQITLIKKCANVSRVKQMVLRVKGLFLRVKHLPLRVKQCIKI